MPKFNIGDKVQKISDKTVGTIKEFYESSNGVKYQITLSNGTMPWISEDNLELYEEVKDPIELFRLCNFFGIDSLKRILSYQRLAGGLTNIIYSMNNSMTDYMAHQFLPVIKFLKSPEERLLIADEVGLGKTIEAMYIWKELEARRGAKRLLVVCPAALREKWRNDMVNLFGISPDFVNAKELNNKIDSIKVNRNERFALICSMESVRSKKTDGFSNICKLNYELEEFHDKFPVESLFDLTIIDEAHYLRNRETANFKTGSRIRDVSHSLVLLSATPIQTAAENLFSILQILSPDNFDNLYSFNYMMEKDRPFIELANCLQKTNSDIDEFDKIIKTNNSNILFRDNGLVQKLSDNKEKIFASMEQRMKYSEELRSFVFYDNYFNRTRRRFVFTNNAKRDAHAVEVRFTEQEQLIYQRVSRLIREMAKSQSTIMTFALIARQRQMASCLPAAFKDWQEKYKTFQQEYSKFNEIEDYSDSETDELNEIVFGDFSSENEIIEETNVKVPNLNPFYEAIVTDCADITFEELKRNDSKYKKFLNHIKAQLSENPKIIVFSFFRGTNEYLENRLTEDGVKCVAIKGGMGELKDACLKQFRDDPSINVLISSEVGSEGLDLQFSSTEYNYDLPWNPMRLEQRIGRIDRIGQKAKKLKIFNLYCADTIEDRILYSLYDRVDIFKNSIGDIEDIVGKPIQDLAIELLDTKLTDAEREELAKQKEQVLIEKRQMNERLEEESGLLDRYRDLVLDSINNAKENKRFLDGQEMIFLIHDFLETFFSGSKFMKIKNKNYYALRMSADARMSFKEFRRYENMSKVTNIDSSDEVLLAFDLKKTDDRYPSSELVDLDHPIFDWIKYVFKNKPQTFHGCSAISMKSNPLLAEGEYVYYIQRWESKGMEKSVELKYFLCNVNTKEIFDEGFSEKILNNVIVEGQTLLNANIRLRNFEPYFEAGKMLYNHAWDRFETFEETINLKKETQFLRQKIFLTETMEKRIKHLEERIKQQKQEGKSVDTIHRNEKRIQTAKNEYEMAIKRLENDMVDSPENNEIAIGVLIVE